MNPLMLLGLAGSLIYGYVNRTSNKIKMWKSVVFYIAVNFLLIALSVTLSTDATNAISEGLGKIGAGVLFGWIVNAIASRVSRNKQKHSSSE